jgi:uncharacterized protein (TIGR02145 family)
MKAKKSFTTLTIILSLAFALSSIPVSAMTYQDEVNVQFTFEPSLSISLSSPNLIISNLVPGNYSNSNTITVDVNTNNVAGYTLTAKVGGTGQTAANNSLVNTLSNTAFTSLGDSDNIILPNFSDNKWGFSTAASITDATTFSGLLYNEDKVINATTNYTGTAATGYTGTSSTNFTIGAKASADQAAGDYTNVITFTAVTNAVPDSTPPSDCSVSVPNITYMQEINNSNKSAVLASMIQDAQYHLLDSRDGKSYCVAKLADGNIWMTQNLDHDIVTTQGFYTYANTDIGHGSTPNTQTTWTAPTATYATSNTTWNNSRYEPESYDPGDLCWNGTLAPDYDGTLSTYAEACGNDKHYHIGNYYNWTAAVAMNDSSSYTTYKQDADQSICPAGWRLPTYSGDKSYANLRTTLSLTSGTSGNIQSAPAYFVYGGDWYGSSYGVGNGGYYWSSVVRDGLGAYEFYFGRYGYVNPQVVDDRGYGSSVRCVAR